MMTPAPKPCSEALGGFIHWKWHHSPPGSPTRLNKPGNLCACIIICLCQSALEQDEPRSKNKPESKNIYSPLMCKVSIHKTPHVLMPAKSMQKAFCVHCTPYSDSIIPDKEYNVWVMMHFRRVFRGETLWNGAVICHGSSFTAKPFRKAIKILRGFCFCSDLPHVWLCVVVLILDLFLSCIS